VRLSASGTGEPATVNEATIIKTIELPFGQEWALYADANVIVLSPCLDGEGGAGRSTRSAPTGARRSPGRSARSDPDSASTQPLASVSAAAE
jgi:hypothetical protein